MNLTDLTRRARRHLAEAGTGQYSETDIQNQIVRSARDLARQFHLFKGVTTLSPSPDGNLTLPTDFGGVVGNPVMQGGVSLSLIRPDEVAAYGAPWTIPAYYWGEEWDTGGKVLLYGFIRPPVLLTYHRIPSAPTNTVEAWGGAYDEYHDLIALHAAHQLAGLGGAAGAANGVWLQRFEQRKDEFRAFLATTRLSTARMQFNSLTTFPSRRY